MENKTICPKCHNTVFLTSGICPVCDFDVTAFEFKHSDNIICNNCKKLNDSSMKRCFSCGKSLKNCNKLSEGYFNNTKNRYENFGITSFILGFLAIISCSFYGVSFVFSALSIIFAYLGCENQRIYSIIGIMLSSISIIMSFAFQ